MYKYLAIVLAVLLAIGGAFGFGYRTGNEHQLAKQVTEQQRYENMQSAVAEAIAKQRPIHLHTKAVIERETRTVPDYSHCSNSADGLRAINSALTNEPLSTGESIVPNADSPR